MDKRIVLKMLSSRDIIVSIGDEKPLIIPKENRSIKADDVYRLLNFSRGDKYEVESINEENADAPVLKFFEELITDIVNKLNRITDLDEDEFLTGMEIKE